MPWREDRAPLRKDLECYRREGECGGSRGGLRTVRGDPRRQVPHRRRGLARALGGVDTPFLAFPQEIRRIIYTTNAIEALAIRTRRVSSARSRLGLPKTSGIGSNASRNAATSASAASASSCRP
ncbi:MAG TPA: hypothetical protein ENK57_12365 [Polyangiaceae bacterium]|nr:hypothetical protein [Polyangiaceae bacterium]